MVYENARARERACQRDSASVPARASVGVRLSGRSRERERASASESVCVFHVQGLDMTVVVLVDTCSISVQQRGAFYIWYICSSKHFLLAVCSYMSLFVRVCVMMVVKIYIFIFDTS